MIADQDGWNTDFRKAPRDGTVIECQYKHGGGVRKFKSRYGNVTSLRRQWWQRIDTGALEWQQKFSAWRLPVILPRGTEASHD